MVVAVAFLFERKETLEIKDGYVIIGKVSLWGCRKTENSRLPVCDVKDIVVKPACVLPGYVLSVIDKREKVFFRLDYKYPGIGGSPFYVKHMMQYAIANGLGFRESMPMITVWVFIIWACPFLYIIDRYSNA